MAQKQAAAGPRGRTCSSSCGSAATVSEKSGARRCRYALAAPGGNASARAAAYVSASPASGPPDAALHAPRSQACASALCARP